MQKGSETSSVEHSQNRLLEPSQENNENSQGKKIIVNFDRVENVLTTLTNALKNNQFPYNHKNTILPQDYRNQPEKLEIGPKEHAMFLFNACYYMGDRIANKENNKGFWGFQGKMVSMLTYYLMDEGMIPYFDFPPPIDMHLMRVSIANELVTFEGDKENDNLQSQELLAIMRDFFYNYAISHKINVLRLADAVWLLSQTLCGNQPGNVTLEPLGISNRSGRKTFLIAQPISTEDTKQRLDYQNSCAECPIEETCLWNVPGKYYFVQSRLFRRGQRTKFPETNQNNNSYQTQLLGEIN